MTDAITSIDTRLSAIEQTLSAQQDTLAAMLETVKEILAACASDGSGELVAVLRKIAEGQAEMIARVDALPDVLVDRIND
jgi:uncharacterized coiled-coil protein SlyX